MQGQSPSATVRVYATLPFGGIGATRLVSEQKVSSSDEVVPLLPGRTLVKRERITVSQRTDSDRSELLPSDQGVHGRFLFRGEKL